MSALPTLRVSLDVNIWIAHLLARQSGRKSGASSELVDIVREMRCEAASIQLVMSWDMIATLQDVLGRKGFGVPVVSDFISGLVLLMKSGPDGFEPHVLPEGGGHLPMSDDEDARVLASAIAARVDLLVSNNLGDFRMKDCETFPTRQISRANEAPRDLYALAYERADGVSLVVAHPVDALDWLR